MTCDRCGTWRVFSARRVSRALWWAGVSLLLACPAAETRCCPAAVGDGALPRPRGAARPLLRLRGGQSQTVATCHYELLGLRKDETPGEHHIKHAYHKKALRCHPDRAPPEMKEQAECAFKALKEAYDVLMDPMQRRAYDWGGVGFNAQYMPSANADDMPSAFDNLAEWERYFGVSFSDESREDDSDTEVGGGARDESAQACIASGVDFSAQYMPSENGEDVPSAFDNNLAAWKRYFGGHLSDESPDVPSAFDNNMAAWERYLGGQFCDELPGDGKEVAGGPRAASAERGVASRL